MSIIPLSESQPNFIVKILLLGQSNVGKTSLITRYATNQFSEANNILTIGIDVKKITRKVNQQQLLNYPVWDTAGQQKYKTLPLQYYRGVQGILLVYDICSYQSFRRVEEWLAKIVENCSVQSTILMLIGNKVDLQSRREVSKEEAGLFAEKKQMKFKETSAKTNTKVHEMIDEVFQEIVSKGLLKKKDSCLQLTDVPKKRGDEGNCCS